MQKDFTAAEPVTFEQAAFFPDDILQSISLSFPKEVVFVRGRVDGIRPWPSKESPQWIYGDLAGQNAALSFRCPPDTAPEREGEYVVMSGLLTVKPSQHTRGLDVQLRGDVVGNWTPAPPKPFVYLERPEGRQSLHTFLRNQGLGSLLVLASATGEKDYLTAAAKHRDSPVWIRASGNFGDPQKLLASLDEALARMPVKAVAFVRGGGDPSGLRFWDDGAFIERLLAKNIPFYTAIGHSDRLLLADKYADESFATPTAFGDALGQTVSRLESERALRTKVAKLESLLDRRTRMTKVMIVAALFLSLLSLGLAWWLLRH
jgi:exodeoxyribonuclease VII large subunit